MAGIIVDYYNIEFPAKNIIAGKLSITPRGNGYEFKILRNDGTLIRKEYSLRNNGFSIFTNSSSNGLYIFEGRWYNDSPLFIKKDDAMRLYDFFADLIEWSPAALASGIAHPDLMAAQQRHSAVAATPSAGGGGSSRRKARKTRKSRKSRKARK
jgi:hypothetical protein